MDRYKKAGGPFMNIFKTFSLKWWQAGIFKLGMWAIGIAVGAWFHTFFAGFYPILIAIAVICLGYTTAVWIKQQPAEETAEKVSTN